MPDLTLAKKLIEDHAQECEKNGRLGKVDRYVRGDADLPYMPHGAKAEYKLMAEHARTNWLALVVDAYTKGLFVDGYREAGTLSNADAWADWQANGLDARQTIAHRGAFEHGTSYVLVLPGDTHPVIRPLRPMITRAVFEDPESDEFPVAAIIARGATADGKRLYDYLDKDNVYRVRNDDAGLVVLSTKTHGMGGVPLVAFRERLDGQPCGLVAPNFLLQDRINEIVFSISMAIQYGSFRQRWATGLAIPLDEDEFLADGVTPNPHKGQPVMPFQSAIDRVWTSDNPEAKFGDFSQTQIEGHLAAYDKAIDTLAATAQISRAVMTGDMVNLSADALAASDMSYLRRLGEYENIFGESWERVLRLGRAAQRDKAGASDTSSQVRWRDAEARSISATMDALTKMQALGVPAQALWERIPGVTDQDLEAWKALANTQKTDGFQQLADALTANTQATTASQALTTATPPANAPASPNPPA